MAHNCTGIMGYRNGVRSLRVFADDRGSLEAFKALWGYAYGGYPSRASADRYTGKDHAVRWLCLVYRSYLHVTMDCKEEGEAFLARLGI